MPEDVRIEDQLKQNRDLRIAQVETIILDLPIRREHKLSGLTMAHQSYLLTKITTHGGLVGYGEGVTPGGPWWSGESVETMKTLIDNYLAPAIVDLSVTNIRVASLVMDRVAARAPFAKAAIEIALWDGAAKAANLQLSDMFGGKIREGVDLRWALASGNLSTDLQEIEHMMSNDLARSFKIKGGVRSAEEELAYTAELRRELGPDVPLQIDLNANWDRTTALKYGPRFMELVSYLEQPLAEWDISGLAELRAASVGIMADESLYTPQDAIRLAQDHAVDIFALKTMKSKGLSGLRAIGEIASATGIDCYAGTFMESSLGIAAHLQLATTLPALTQGGELLGGLWLAEEYVEEPVTYRNGEVVVPSGQGHGMTPDPEKVRHFARA
ncbi:muconate/chloromuconate family cycloisomerase [uncultured Ruegeria sp.]|uniref:muconate/chloromuconate family cycloisomerase n=1 Tax=uncultured Ruegeria sp. TaxID=259304 RepID=UPI00262FF4A4|nr:muconate/chloromuconate family cycloisomerase [uncultured Ruegeria sp.]